MVILEYKSIICAGFSCVLHIHNAVEEVEIAVRESECLCVCLSFFSLAIDC